MYSSSRLGAERGHGCTGEGAKKILQDVAWDGGFQLHVRNWIGWARFSWSGDSCGGT